jgi:4-hydroxy-3-polyprenylbenzoate decarboxylase
MTALDPSGAPHTAPQEERRYPRDSGASAILINATRKWNYPPVSLPKKAFMERAKEIWEELELPRIIPKSPWFGYELGHWNEGNREEADLALRGEHYQTGEKLAKDRTQV